MDISLQVLILIALLVVMAKAAGGLGARIGIPPVFGEFIAGVILGPTAINIWRISLFAPHPAGPHAAAVSLEGVIQVLAELGVVVLMFLAGLESDVGVMRNALGTALGAAAGGVILPLVGGAWLAHWAGFAWREAIFIGTILTATSVSITAQTLLNLDRIRSKTGSIILGAAVMDDVLGLIVLSVVIALDAPSAFAGQTHSMLVAGTILRVLMFSGLLLWLGPRLVRWAFRQSRHLHGPHTGSAMALALAFFFAFLAQYAGGMAAITGAYLAGLFVATAPSHEEVIGEIRAMTNSFFGPLFFASVGLEIDVWKLAGHVQFFVLILLVAILGKVLGCGLPVRMSLLPVRDALAVGIGMIPRGEVGLITANIGWAAGLVSSKIYALVVILVLATTLITPLLLRLAYALPHSSPSPGAATEIHKAPESSRFGGNEG